MSTFQTQQGQLKTKPVILSTTSATAILTATAETGPMTVEFVNLANVAANTPTVIVDIYDGSSVLAKIRGTKAMVANTPERIEGPFVLEPTWILRATASAVNEVHVTATYSTPG